MNELDIALESPSAICEWLDEVKWKSRFLKKALAREDVRKFLSTCHWAFFPEEMTQVLNACVSLGLKPRVVKRVKLLYIVDFEPREAK